MCESMCACTLYIYRERERDRESQWAFRNADINKYSMENVHSHGNPQQQKTQSTTTQSTIINCSFQVPKNCAKFAQFE